VRNPWGDATEWKGDWGDTSALWTDENKDIIKKKTVGKGF